MAAANTPKPVPSDDILTSAKANAAYSADVETWGDTVSRAWGRICRTLSGQKVTLVGGETLPCPAAPKAAP